MVLCENSSGSSSTSSSSLNDTLVWQLTTGGNPGSRTSGYSAVMPVLLPRLPVCCRCRFCAVSVVLFPLLFLLYFCCGCRAPLPLLFVAAVLRCRCCFCAVSGVVPATVTASAVVYYCILLSPVAVSHNDVMMLAALSTCTLHFNIGFAHNVPTLPGHLKNMYTRTTVVLRPSCINCVPRSTFSVVL